MNECHCVDVRNRLAMRAQTMEERKRYDSCTISEVILMMDVIAQSLCPIFEYLREQNISEMRTLFDMQSICLGHFEFFLSGGSKYSFAIRYDIKDAVERTVKSRDSVLNIEFFEGIFYRWFEELESGLSLSYYHFSLLDRNEVFAIS